MAEYDLVGIGNALVDVLATVDDSFLEAQALDKGGNDAGRYGSRCRDL